MRFISIFSFFTFFALCAWSKNAAFKTPVYGGSGCQNNKAVAVLSPDGSALSVMFNDYTVISGGITNRSFTYKNCDIQIPIEIPDGLQLGIVGADYRGFNDLPCNTRSILTLEYAFTKSSSLRYTKTFLGPIVGENYFLHQALKTEKALWSKCGQSSTILQVKSSINVQTNAAKKQATSAIDSLDLAFNPSTTNGITLYFKWMPCQTD